MYYLNISSCNLLIMGWNENAANSVTGYFNHVTVNELIDIWKLLSRLNDCMRRKQWHTLKLCEILLPWYTNDKLQGEVSLKWILQSRDTSYSSDTPLTTLGPHTRILERTPCCPILTLSVPSRANILYIFQYYNVPHLWMVP